ncbi:DUF4416 family protein [Candidatus Omnitrophota bacterium]
MQAKKPRDVKLVIGMLAKDKKLFDKTEEFFVKEFGEMDYKSPVLKFDYTDYYKKEMGQPLKRKFVSFKKLIPPERISKIKTITNSLEQKLAIKKKGLLKRRVNIDPGYISDAKLVLATTKNYCHRICIARGLYAEVTLGWRKGGFQPFDWTYPDYRTKKYLSILNNIRSAYIEEERHAG